MALRIGRPPPGAYGVSIDGPPSVRAGRAGGPGANLLGTPRSKRRHVPLAMAGPWTGRRRLVVARRAARQPVPGEVFAFTDGACGLRHCARHHVCRCLVPVGIGRSVGLLLRYRMSRADTRRQVYIFFNRLIRLCVHSRLIVNRIRYYLVLLLYLNIYSYEKTVNA